MRVRAGEPATRSQLERAEAEEDLAGWLQDRGVADPWEIAGTFAEAGLSVEDLASLSDKVPAAALGDAILWIACGLAAEKVAGEIASASERISSLIQSIKGYSHMDRSSEHRPTDVREGLDSTLTMLAHKLKQKGIRLERDYQKDLPAIPAHAGELNQVWTNLIDNAIDAMGEGGELRIVLPASRLPAL